MRSHKLDAIAIGAAADAQTRPNGACGHALSGAANAQSRPNCHALADAHSIADAAAADTQPNSISDGRAVRVSNAIQKRHSAAPAAGRRRVLRRPPLLH